MSGDMGQALKARQEVVAPEKARFWIKRGKQSLQSRTPVCKTLSEVNKNTSSMKMSLPIGIFLCLVIVSMGLAVYAVAEVAEAEKEANAMETSIKSRSDYPDYDDLSSFFDFEIGPPQITYKDADDMSSKSSLIARPNSNKNYYYYHSENHPSHEKLHYSSPAKKHVVTPGTHYKSSTEKTFVEGEVKSNESNTVLSQAKVGQYQVSVVEANSPILSNLGLTPEYLRRLSGYEKRATNSTMLASDSTQSATYAANPHQNYQHSGYQQSNSQNAPPQQPYDSSKYPPPSSSYAERQYKPNEHYHPSNSYGGYNQASASHHPPPQGSYDAKSYRAVQNGQNQNSKSYAPPYYNPHQSHNNHNIPPPQSVPYNNPHQVSYNNPPSPSYNNPPSPSYNNPPSPSYNNPPAPSYNNPPPPPSYNNPSSSSPSSYSPQRSSGEPWRQVTQHNVDWDDKQSKKDSWQSGPYPPHPPPLPYSSTSSSTGSYYPKPAYDGSGDKSGHRLAATYNKPEPASKPTYSSSSASSSDYSSHKPYYSSSTYSSSAKVPSRAGSVNIAASNHHDHHHAPSKPGITIRFKSKSPSHHGHSHGHGHGVSIPLGFNPLDVVKKLLPSLNPLNNKKVTIGITIENKKDHHTEFHPY